MLEYHRVGARTDGAMVLVLLHGRGADAADMLQLGAALPADFALIAPRAPFEAAPWGYGPGRAWYRYLGEDRPEPDSFESSQAQLTTFLDGLPGALDFAPGPIVLGGFSQGGTMSLGQALRRPGEVPTVINFSGFLPAHPTVVPDAASVRGTRFFWGHGTRDPNIPFSLAERGRAALERADADLTIWDGRIGHWIDPDELSIALAWAREAPAGRAATGL